MSTEALAARLADGEPPLRVAECARILGFSTEKLRRLIRSGQVRSVNAPWSHEGRVPADEARRMARDLGLLA